MAASVWTPVVPMGTFFAQIGPAGQGWPSLGGDKTRKFTRKLTSTFVTSSHPWIGEDAWFEHNKETGVPDFGSFRYYDCASDGTPMSTKFGWLSYNRVSSKGAVQISTGAIHSAGFTSTFEHP
jgi:hypothetical protein